MKQVSKKEAKSLMLVNSMNKYCKNIIYKITIIILKE